MQVQAAQRRVAQPVVGGDGDGLVELRRRLREEERDLVVGREQRQRVDGALRVEEEGGAGGAVVGREAEAALQRDALGVSAARRERLTWMRAREVRL